VGQRNRQLPDGKPQQQQPAQRVEQQRVPVVPGLQLRIGWISFGEQTLIPHDGKYCRQQTRRS